MNIKQRLRHLLWLQNEVREFHHVMGWGDAFRLARSKTGHGEIRFYLTPCRCEVSIRCGTTDIDCLRKVFLAEEYKSPFPSDPRVIMDAGANTGMVTLYYSQRYPNARIIAIEPEPSNFELLKRNCAHLPNVTFVQGALWDREAPLAIQDSSEAKCSFQVGESDLPLHSSGLIESITIPGLMQKLGVGTIDILKIDIEGAEYPLFKDCDAWLGSVGQIAIELHDRIRLGCAQAFYAAVGRRPFALAVRGENVFINLRTESQGKWEYDYRKW